MAKGILMNILTDKRQITRLTMLFMLTYMASYITRINYGAIISEMEVSTGITRDLLSMALTGSFITYGGGQIVSGILGDRISPKKLVSLGLVVTVAMNLLIPLCGNAYAMLGVWCVNGFAQSFMWPPLVRLMTALLTEEDYKNACTKVSWGSSFGTIAVYLIAPGLIFLAGWKSVFLFSALCGVAMLLIWWKLCPDISTQPVQAQPKAAERKPIAALFTPLVLCVMAAIVLQGMLRDGVTTWMPTYISDTFSLGTGVSILTGVVLPLFSIGCFQLANKLYAGKLNNPLTCALLFFGVGALAALGLYFLGNTSAVVSVALSALLAGCMHGVNLILICMVPPFFKKLGIVSTVSGVLNACTYIGSAISTYGIAVLSRHAGWQNTILIWVLIAAAGGGLCLIAAKPWKMKYM